MLYFANQTSQKSFIFPHSIKEP